AQSRHRGAEFRFFVVLCFRNVWFQGLIMVNAASSRDVGVKSFNLEIVGSPSFPPQSLLSQWAERCGLGNGVIVVEMRALSCTNDALRLHGDRDASRQNDLGDAAVARYARHHFADFLELPFGGQEMMSGRDRQRGKASL